MTKPWGDPTKTSDDIRTAKADAEMEALLSQDWQSHRRFTPAQEQARNEMLATLYGEGQRLSLTMGRKQGGYASPPRDSAIPQRGHTAALGYVDEIAPFAQEEFWSAIGYPVRIDVILPSCFTQPPTDPIAHNLHMAAQQIRLYEHLTGSTIDAETRRDMARAYVAKIGGAL